VLFEDDCHILSLSQSESRGRGIKKS